MPPTLPPARWALTPPFHPCPSEPRPRAVCSLWRFPSGRPGRALPAAISPWSPDFPRPVAGRGRPAIRAHARLRWEPRPGQRKRRDAPPRPPPRAPGARAHGRQRSRTAASTRRPVAVGRRVAGRRGRGARRPASRPARRRRRRSAQSARPPRASRRQSNFGPGSALRPGARSEWAITPAGGMPQRAQDRVEQPLERGHLRLGERREAGERAGVGELDADRARVDVAAPGPAAGAGVPGALVLVDQAPDPAVLGDQVVRRDLRRRVAEPVERRLGASASPCSAARRAPAAAPSRRGPKFGLDRRAISMR